MSVTVIKKFVRPSTQVDFPRRVSNSEKAHILENYVLPGKLLFQNLDISDDGLTRTTTRIFANQAAHNQFKTDPALDSLRAEQATYCSAHNITITSQKI